MQRKTAWFFDIDGTLWGPDNQIPASAKEAIRGLRKNGHLAFLCSGRSRAYIQDPKLLGIGFDGIVSGCATMIEYHGQTLFYKRLEPEMAAQTILMVRAHGFHPILEGPEYLYMDDAEFAGDAFGEKLRRELGDRIKSIAGEWGKWEVSKLSCDTRGADLKPCYKKLRENFDLMIHNEAVVEIVPKGCHKGYGITSLCRFLKMDAADTFAVGDSVNDLEMFRAAGTGIAMGNGIQAVKDAADYVTAPLTENGVWEACRHFGVI